MAISLEHIFTSGSNNSNGTPINIHQEGGDLTTISFNQGPNWPSNYEEGRHLMWDKFPIPPTPNPDGTYPLTSLFNSDDDPIDSTAAETLRGGMEFSTLRREQDWIRLGRFFDTPQGKAFKKKQIGLQLMNPRVDSPQKGLVEVGMGALNSLTFGLTGLPDPNQWIYNDGLNTKVSSILSGIVSIPREGILPGQHYGYDDVTKRSLWQKVDNGEELGALDTPPLTHKEGNRLVYLHTNKVSDESTGGSLGLLSGLGAPGTTFGNILGFLTGNGEELFSYLAGPSSILGIGRTTHFRYTNSTIDNYAKPFLGPGSISKAMTIKDPIKGLHGYPSASVNAPINFSIGTGQPYFDYNKEIIKGTETRTYHRESRLGLGHPGRKLTPLEKLQIKNDKGEIKYSVFIPDKIDKINKLDIIHDDGNGDFRGLAYRDMIRFRFEAIDNDTDVGKPLNSDVMVFRAFLDDLGDDFTAEHNTFKYNGRGEEFYTYKGFKRSISLSFKIAAQSRHEMMPLYRKLNFLVSNTAPDYGKSGRMKTPYMRMTVGHYFNRIPGIINSVKLNWDKDYPWEINLDGPEEVDDNGNTVSQTLILPHILDVNLSFTPIHNFLPQKGIQTPFILPQAIDGGISKYQDWLSRDSENIDTVYQNVGKSQKEIIDGVAPDPPASSEDKRVQQPYHESLTDTQT